MKKRGERFFVPTLFSLPLALVLSTTALGVSAAEQATNGPMPAAAFLLARGTAGQFEVGMTVDAVYQLAGQENIRLVASFPEGMFQSDLRIQLPGRQGGPSLVARITQSACHEFVVWGILVNDARFRTRDGFGVGSITTI